MIKIGSKGFKIFYIALGFLSSFLLTGCGGSSGTSDNKLSMNMYGFDLNYDGKVKLERVLLKTDDPDEIVDLFQEVGNNSSYKDSLLIAEKYGQGLGANAFAQDNLDVLSDQGLTLSDLKKTQIGLKKHGERINAVLVEYQIKKGLIDDIPLLFVSQLFIPKDKDMILMSYITEDQSSHLNASNMFKNIK